MNWHLGQSSFGRWPSTVTCLERLSVFGFDILSRLFVHDVHEHRLHCYHCFYFLCTVQYYYVVDGPWVSITPFFAWCAVEFPCCTKGMASGVVLISVWWYNVITHCCQNHCNLLQENWSLCVTCAIILVLFYTRRQPTSPLSLTEKRDLYDSSPSGVSYAIELTQKITFSADLFLFCNRLRICPNENFSGDSQHGFWKRFHVLCEDLP